MVQVRLRNPLLHLWLDAVGLMWRMIDRRTQHCNTRSWKMSADTICWRTSRLTNQPYGADDAVVLWWKKQVETILLMWKRMLRVQVHAKVTCTVDRLDVDTIDADAGCWLQSSEDVAVGRLTRNRRTPSYRGSAEDAVLHTNVERTTCRPQDHDSMLRVTD